MRTILTILAAIPGVLCGQASAADPKQPNILFIMVDEMKWNVMSCAGHAIVKTPNLDRLAREGTRFATAYTVAPICTPQYKFINNERENARRGDIKPELYDLIQDPLETKNLAQEPAHAAILKELAAQLEAWHKDIPPVPVIQGVAPQATGDAAREPRKTRRTLKKEK